MIFRREENSRKGTRQLLVDNFYGDPDTYDTVLGSAVHPCACAGPTLADKNAVTLLTQAIKVAETQREVKDYSDHPIVVEALHADDH